MTNLVVEALPNQIFYTADLHFGHRKIIEYCGRPWVDVDAMREGLIERWNAVVGDDDIVNILGDFSFMGKTRDREVLARLKGRKFLIRGNHDWSKYKAGKPYEGFCGVDDDGALYDANGNVLWVMSHLPYRDAGDHTPGEERYHDQRLPDEGKWLLHGHVHNAWRVKGKQINVGVDVWDWTPVHISKIHALIQQQTTQVHPR